MTAGGPRWWWRAPGVELPLAPAGPGALLARRPFLFTAGLYAGLLAMAAWRLWPRFGSAWLGGGETAAPVLWRLWWLKELLLGADAASFPFSTHLVGWPEGAPVRGLDVPGALLALPFWPAVPHIPEVALANATSLAALLAAGILGFAAARELWGGLFAPLAAGALFLLAPSQLAAAGSLAARAVPWGVLFFLGLSRTLRRRGVAGPLLAAVGLALAALASAAALAACLAGGAALSLIWAARQGRSLRDPALSRRALLLLLAAALLLAPLFPALLGAARSAGELASGNATILQGLRVVHPGVALLALGVAGAARSRAARPWLAVALSGVVLAFTPARGAASSWLVALGLAVAAGAALAPFAAVGWRPRGAAVLLTLALVALAEASVGLAVEAAPPPSRFLRALARDPEPWAVLDLSLAPRALYHQVLHRHPQLADPLAGRRGPDLSASTSLQGLQAKGVRFIVAEKEGGEGVAPGAPLVHRGDGLWVYEVPARLP